MIVLDTVFAATNQFSLRSSHKFRVVPCNPSNKDDIGILTFRDTGECVYNKKLIYYRGLNGSESDLPIKITVYPKKGYMEGMVLFIAFELPKLVYGNNVNATDYMQNKEVLDTISTLLDELGIDVKLEKFKLIRFDLARNFIIPRQLDEFSFIINLGKNIQQSSINAVAHELEFGDREIHYLSKGNKGFRISIYDKSRQMKRKGFEIQGLDDEEELFRIECQFRNVTGDKVTKELYKIGLPNKLTIIADEEEFKKLCSLYFKKVNLHLLPFSVFGDSKIRDKNMLKSLMKKRGFSKIRIYRAMDIYEALRHGNILEYVRIAESAGLESGSYLRSEIEFLTKNFPMLGNSRYQLYTKIRDKVFNECHCAENIEVTKIKEKEIA